MLIVGVLLNKKLIVVRVSGSHCLDVVRHVSGFFAKRGLNIVDIEQNAFHGIFSMLLVVDPGLSSDLNFLEKEICDLGIKSLNRTENF